MGRNKEQSARMLGHLVSNAPRLIRPYMEPILKVSYSRAIYLFITFCLIPVSVKLLHFFHSYIFTRFRRTSLEHGGCTNFTAPFQQRHCSLAGRSKSSFLSFVGCYKF